MKHSDRILRFGAALAGAALFSSPATAQGGGAEAMNGAADEAGLTMVPLDAGGYAVDAPSSSRSEDQDGFDLSSILERRFSRRSPSYAFSEPTTGRNFVLDRSDRRALLKFDDDSEVYVLRASNGPRGDEFLKTDTGRVLARVTELGNVILFSSDNRSGMPTAKQGEADKIPPPAAPESLTEFAQSVSQRLSERADIRAGVIISGDAAATPGWAAETLSMGVRGVFKAGPTAVSLDNIYVEAGPGADAVFQDGVLVMRFAAEDGYAGRPSSDAVATSFKSAKSGQ